MTATGHNEEMVRIKISKKDRVKVGAKELMDEGGVDMATMEDIPLPVVTDVPASSKVEKNDAEVMHNFYVNADVEKKLE